MAHRPLDSRLTEQRNPRTARIDQLSTQEIVDYIRGAVKPE
jgi:N-acetylmuramic acid 6-phosphate (MurNAc-6-P) etherase